MSDIGAGINQKLLATAGVAAICGTRGYPDALPINETLPAYTYAIVSDNSEHHMGGFAALAQARIQFDCFALTRKAANELGTAIRKAIQGERGTWGGEHVRTCHKENEFTRYEPPLDGSDAGRYVKTIDFLVNYKES